MPKEIDIKIGRLLRRERTLRGFSQQQLGDSLDITFQQVQKYESGINRISLSSLLVMLNFLKINPGDFIKGVSGVQNPKLDQDLSYVRDFLRLPVKIRKKMVSLLNVINEDA